MTRFADTEVLVEAAGALNIISRADKQRWAHLSLCVLDAVFSIGARYGGVVRVCREYAKYAELSRSTVAHRDFGTVVGVEHEQPLEAFAADITAVGVDGFASDVVHHRGLTSTRNGILKADAALRYAELLVAHDIRFVGDVATLLADPGRLAVVENGLRAVPGHGTGCVRLGYLWMLAGDDENVKPDRMVLRWLRAQGADVGTSQARELLTAIARRIGCTPWELDHAIWRAQSGRTA